MTAGNKEVRLKSQLQTKGEAYIFSPDNAFDAYYRLSIAIVLGKVCNWGAINYLDVLYLSYVAWASYLASSF